VDLTLKNSEYKVVDEKDDSNAAESESENVPVRGIYFQDVICSI
jgi:hypothetical protein